MIVYITVEIDNVEEDATVTNIVNVAQSVLAATFPHNVVLVGTDG